MYQLSVMHTTFQYHRSYVQINIVDDSTSVPKFFFNLAYYHIMLYAYLPIIF